ncbi:MAG: histidine kinase [Chitinophagaceae bacterium]|nr:histidine kinase [Chitinophagaceae bacterium]
MKRIVYLFFLQCLWGFGVFAQVYSNDYDLFTTRDGLPHNNILSALQDSYGLLWLGTYSGLSVYDGSSFKTYKPFAGQEDNWIYAIETIYEDASGNLWIGTWGGLVSCFDRKEQKFITYKAKPIQAKIRCFYRDPGGQVWIGYEDGLLGHIRNDSVQTRRVTGEHIACISGAGPGHLALLSEGGRYRYDVQSGAVHTLAEYSGIGIQDIDKSKFPTVAMGTHGFYRLDDRGLQRREKIAVPQKSRGTAYAKVASSVDGCFYYTDGVVICKYDSLDQMKESYTISDNITFNESNVINVFLEDRSGILWLGTSSGLYKIDQKKHQFQKYSTNAKAGYLTHNYVRAVYIDHKNNAWVGFRFGKLNQLRSTGADKFAFHKSYSMQWNGNKTICNNYSVNTIFETKDGSILAGGEIGIAKVAGGKLVPFLPGPYQEEVILVWALYEDREGNIWAGTAGRGLFIYDSRNRKLHRYVHAEKDSASIPDNKVWKILEDSRGDIWLGTDKGLVRAETGAGISAIAFRRFGLPGAESPNVWSITEDHTQHLWIGTTGNGVFKMALSSMQAQPISKVRARVISAIVIDKMQNAWISTIGGLYQYHTGRDTAHYYSEDDGLLSNDFNFNAAAITPSGKVFLGAKTGLVFFDPQKIAHCEATSAKVMLTALLVNGKEATKSLYGDSSIVLPYNENNFSIDFALLHFSPAKPFKYRYLLKNYNNGWTYLPDRQNRAFYNKVPPGMYRFVVQASTDGIHWYGQEHLDIVIRPAFWQMPVFRIGIIALLTLGIILLIRMRFVKAIRSERTQAKIEKQIAELELKALQAQMNPHFIFNTMNSIQHFILSHNEVEANNYLSRFARLMRLVLESSKNKYISLKAELESLSLYLSLEQLRFEDQFEYEIIVAEGIEPEQLMIPSLLIQPFVENAIKHGLAGKPSGGLLRLSFDRKCSKAGCIRVCIEDNGIGRANAAKTGSHTSRGIQLIEDRVKTYNLIENRKISIRFVDKENPEEGTIVEIEIPLE